MAYLLIAFPLVAAAAAFAVPSNRWRPWLLPLGGAGHLALVGYVLAAPPLDFAPGAAGWLALDPVGKLVLGFVSLLFFLCSLYAPGYLAVRAQWSNRVLCGNLLVSLSMMTL